MAAEMRRNGADAWKRRRRTSCVAAADRAGATLLLLAMGWTAGACVKAADLVDAAFMAPVLVEDFEAPPVQETAAYQPGHILKTDEHRWDVLAGRVEHFNVIARPDSAAYDGAQAVHLADGAILATTVPTVPKKQYTFTFHYAHHPELGGTAARARVVVFGEVGALMEAEVDHGGVAPTSYRRYSGTFTADGARTAVRFTSLTPGPFGMILDGISVRMVPGPLPTPPGAPRLQ